MKLNSFASCTLGIEFVPLSNFPYFVLAGVKYLILTIELYNNCFYVEQSDEEMWLNKVNFNLFEIG